MSTVTLVPPGRLSRGGEGGGAGETIVTLVTLTRPSVHLCVVFPQGTLLVVVDVFDNDNDFFPFINEDEFVDQFILTSVNESPASFRGRHDRSVTVSQLPLSPPLYLSLLLQRYHHCFPHCLLQSGLLWRRYVCVYTQQ